MRRSKLLACVTATAALAGGIGACGKDSSSTSARSEMLSSWRSLTTTMTPSASPGAGEISRCAQLNSQSAENDVELPLACALHRSGRSGLTLAQFLNLLSALQCKLGRLNDSVGLVSISTDDACFKSIAPFRSAPHQKLLVEIREVEIVGEAAETRFKVSLWNSSNIDFPRYISFEHELRADGFELRFEDWHIFMDPLRSEVFAQSSVQTGDNFTSLKVRAQGSGDTWEVLTVNAIAGAAKKQGVRIGSYQGNPGAGFLSSTWSIAADADAARLLSHDYCFGGEAACAPVASPLFNDDQTALLIGNRFRAHALDVKSNSYLLKSRADFFAALGE